MPQKMQKMSKRRWCAGDLNQFINLQQRDIQPGVIDHGQAFTTSWTVRAAVQTLTTNGALAFFDGVNTSTTPTHLFVIRYVEGVTAEHWIEFDGRRFDILNVEPVDERREFIRIIANERGAADLEAAKA